MSEIVPCPACGAKNRLGTPPAGQLPRCGRCRATLPWLTSATDSTFAGELDAPVPVLVDFWAPWCGPCRTIAPALEELARENAGRLKVVKVNVDQNPGLSRTYQVSGIPALLLFAEGEVVERMVGAQPKAALARQIAPHLPQAATAH